LSTSDVRQFSTPTCKPECAHASPITGRCNAHTRAGRLCSHAAGERTDHPGAGRCYLHGGRTPRGKASPHFKHGLDSRYITSQLEMELLLFAAVRFVLELATDLRERGPLESLWRMQSMSAQKRRDLAIGLERMAAGGWILK
jgi:hypothetical protein